MVENERHIGAVDLMTRLLWNRDLDGSPRRTPIVVLLGPWGSGKSEALKAVSGACGDGVVHGTYDFAAADATSTQALLDLVSVAGLSRGWRHRGTPRFTRFTLSLMAVQIDVRGLTPDQARARLDKEIHDATASFRADRISRLVGEWAKRAKAVVPLAAGGNPLPPRIVDAIVPVLPSLISELGRRGWRSARQWVSERPEAEGAGHLDGLLKLNSLVRAQPDALLPWLADAFLADVRENHARMAHADEGSGCDCRRERKHWHNWVLLLDNIHLPAGRDLVEELLAARGRQLQQDRGAHDPLLVIATSGRWDARWDRVWCPVWKTPPDGGGGRLYPVRLCRDADYDHWASTAASNPAFAGPPSPYFPVLLEPLDGLQIAKELGVGLSDPRCRLVQRATDGLPIAVIEAKRRLGKEVAPGSRDALVPVRLNVDDGGLWESLHGHGTAAGGFLGATVEEFTAAAPFAVAPWLISDQTAAGDRPSNIGRLLTELRSSLWITATYSSGVTEDHARLHPWLAGALISDLAKDGDRYRRQFETLLNDPATALDVPRRAYGLLATGQINQVAELFEREFDRMPHQDWVHRLELVTSAPDNQPLDVTSFDLYRRLIDHDADYQPATGVGNTVRRLIAAKWLAANPFAVADRKQDELIEKQYRALANSATLHNDVSPLDYAADAAAGRQPQR